MPRAFNPNPRHPAVGFLVQLHADLGGKIEKNREEAKRLAESMKHVEAVIRMFAPEYDVRRIAVKRRQQVSQHFKRGHLIRAIIDVLKAAPEPLTVREITRAVLAGQGIANPEDATVRVTDCNVRVCLKYKEGKIVERVGEGMPARWRLIGAAR
jgi:hypothetical protein